MAEPVDTDFTKPFRGVPRMVELVRYVLATSSANEADWIEWKVGLDLTRPPGRFAVARQIIGFANRDPRRAAAHAGGCAYVIVGVEPGNLAGTAALDLVDLEAGIRLYVGDDGPVWQPYYVRVDGADVLVVSVEPPQFGDPIHTLRKEYSAPSEPAVRDGTVLIRRGSGIQQASSAEQRMLQQRLLNRPAVGLEIVVESVGSPIPRVDLSDDAVAEWIAQERTALLEPLEAEERARASTVTRPLTAEERRTVEPALQAAEAFRKSGISLNQIQKLFGGPTHLPENRSPEDYRSEVDEYLAAAGRAVAAFAWDQFEDVITVPLQLRVTNTGDRNLEAVEVVVNLPGSVLTFDEPTEVDMPNRPRPWGPRPNPALASFDFGGRLYLPSLDIPSTYAPRGFTSRNSGSTVIKYDPFHLRPHKQYELEDVPLVVGSQESGVITGTWQATASNRDGYAAGTVEVVLADSVFSVGDFVSADSDAEEDG